MQESLFQQAVQAFDHANAQDINILRIDQVAHPRELWYAKELTRWVLRLEPNASEALLLAARCQHIERWKVPRSEFPAGRLGYLNWRKELARFHASKSGEILRDVGYSEEIIQRVRELNLKLDIKHDPETQVLEDALCLVFLESQLGEFSRKTDKMKLAEIIHKTWKKMSSKGREMALQLNMDGASRKLIEKAISNPGEGVPMNHFWTFERIGLCEDCEFTRQIKTAKGATFYLCQLSETRPEFPKYPIFPVNHCKGYKSKTG